MKGVFWKGSDPSYPWVVRAIIFEEVVELGGFACEEMAAKAFDGVMR